MRLEYILYGGKIVVNEIDYQSQFHYIFAVTVSVFKLEIAR